MELKVWTPWILVLSILLISVVDAQNTRTKGRQNDREHKEAIAYERSTEVPMYNYDGFDGSGDDMISGDHAIDSEDRYDNEDAENQEEDDDEGSAGNIVDVPATTPRSSKLTRCQEQRNHRQASNFTGGYRPMCTENGAFEPMQCYEATSECWCVDSNGNQIGDVYRAPTVPKCPPEERRQHVGATATDDIAFVTEFTTRHMKTTKGSGDEFFKEDPEMEPIPQKNFFEYILHQPFILAAIIGGSILILVIIILMLMFCIYRMRKKDEGSYSLDEPRQSFNYTRAKDQEFFA